MLCLGFSLIPPSRWSSRATSRSGSQLPALTYLLGCRPQASSPAEASLWPHHPQLKPHKNMNMFLNKTCYASDRSGRSGGFLVPPGLVPQLHMLINLHMQPSPVLSTLL